MGCLDLLASHSPLLIMIVRTALPHVDFATISVPLRCIQTFPTLSLDLPLGVRIVLPLLVGIILIATPHVYVSSVSVTLIRIQTFSMNGFDLSSKISFATHGLAFLPTLSMSVWTL
jgi:hypothetical protein